MSTTRTSQTVNSKSITGLALMIVGSIVMLAYVGMLALQVRAFLNASPTDLLGSGIGLGLASVRLIPSLAFNHGALFSWLGKMLVSFSALVVIVAGLALLQNRSGSKTFDSRLTEQEPTKGEQ
jgi:hypothetical protein